MSFFHSSATERLADTIGAIKLMAPVHLERERELAHCKWFGYRFMSPLAATKHLAELYRRGVQRYARYHQDIDLAASVRGLSHHVFAKPNGSLTELWRARQPADECGLPYELLIDFAFEFAGRRKWKHTPRPIQLFGSKKSGVAWQAEFEKYLADHLPLTLERLSGLPQYRIENYRHLPVQDGFRSCLTRHIREANKRWAPMIGKQCVQDRHLPLRDTLKLVPQEMRRGVISEVKSDRHIGLLPPAAHERITVVAMVPACFGMPFARTDGALECRSCPFVHKCSALAHMVSDRMHDRYGSLSPLQSGRDDRRRDMTRKRVAKFRAKRKAEEACLSAGAS